MKLWVRLVTIILFNTFSLNAFAVCESERNEYNHFNDLCNKLTAASQVAMVSGGIFGTIFAIPTLGLSLAAGGLAGAGPGFAATNACRIRDEKKSNLDRCEANATEAHQRTEEVQRAEVERQRQRGIRIIQVNQIYNTQRTQAEVDFQTAVDRMIQEMVDEGFDVNLPETQEVIRRSREDLRSALNQRLEQIEQQRRQELSQI